MKAVYATICFLAFFLSGCVTGDEITSYVIDSDGTIAFSIYRLNLISHEPGEKAKSELTKYIQDLEKHPGDRFAKANAKKVQVTVIRKASPASALITGRFPSLNNFASYLSEDYGDSRLVLTPIASERTRGLLIEYTQKQQKENAQPASIEPRVNSFEETRFALAQGTFTKAEGFILSQDRRSALLDEETVLKMVNSQMPSITLTLEWQLPEAQ